jgi:hypothetical protein
MKRKILGIPVVVIICLLGIVLASGIAYAGVNLFGGGQATVQVTEPILVTCSDPEAVLGGSAGVLFQGPGAGGGLPYNNTWSLGWDTYLFPNSVATMAVNVTSVSDLPITITIAVVPSLFPGSDYLADGVSMTVDDTGMMVNDPSGGLAILAGSQGDMMFGPTPSVTITLDAGGAKDFNVTFVAGNDAVAGAYAYNIIIERAGVSLPTPA